MRMQGRDFDYVAEALKVPWIIWNTVTVDEKNNNSAAWQERMKVMPKTVPYAEDLFNFWRDRKINDFSDYDYVMAEYKIVPINEHEFSLTMVARSLD